MRSPQGDLTLWILTLSPGVNVDAIEKTASMTPLFIATDESKSKEASIALIKAGKFQKNHLIPYILSFYNFKTVLD